MTASMIGSLLARIPDEGGSVVEGQMGDLMEKVNLLQNENDILRATINELQEASNVPGAMMSTQDEGFREQLQDKQKRISALEQQNESLRQQLQAADSALQESRKQAEIPASSRQDDLDRIRDLERLVAEKDQEMKMRSEE